MSNEQMVSVSRQLLDEAYDDLFSASCGHSALADRIADILNKPAALSASAEPSAPVERDDLESHLKSINGFYEDSVEDIAHALAQECEDAELNPADLVTINRDKLRAIAARAMDKARAALEKKS